MRAVERYRAWALRGPFLLHHDGGIIEVGWPTPDALLSYDPSAPIARRLVHLAGDTAEELLDVVGDEIVLVLTLIIEDLAEHFGCTRGQKLVNLLDRYGADIAADLNQIYDIDILDVFGGRRLPDEVMDRISKFPRHSWLSEALAQDDELAATILAIEGSDDSEPAAPDIRHTEYTPEVQASAAILDRLGDILSAMSSLGGSTINVPPAPRPVGATARLREMQDDDAHVDVLAVVEAAQARYAELHPDETP